jgi:hypothetical protein
VLDPSPTQDARLPWFGFFNPLFIRVLVDDFRGFPATRIFGPMLLEPLVLGTFMKFRCLFGGDFKVKFRCLFGADFLKVDLRQICVAQVEVIVGGGTDS